MGPKRILSKGMVAAALVVLAAACSRSSESVQETAHPAGMRPANVPPGRALVAVPALLKLSVDELTRHVGSPQEVPATVQAALSQMPVFDPTDSTRFFRFRALDMVVSFDAATRRLNDLLLIGSNEDQLMQRAGLSADAASYLLLPVFHAHRPMQLLGLRVVPLAPVQLQ